MALGKPVVAQAQRFARAPVESFEELVERRARGYRAHGVAGYWDEDFVRDEAGEEVRSEVE